MTQITGPGDDPKRGLNTCTNLVIFQQIDTELGRFNCAPFCQERMELEHGLGVLPRCMSAQEQVSAQSKFKVR